MKYYLAIKRNAVLIICNNMSEPWKHYAKRMEPDTKDHISRFHLYEMSRIDKFTETERLVVARGWGRREWGVTANGYRVSF